jgi:hypothetical protein
MKQLRHLATLMLLISFFYIGFMCQRPGLRFGP